MQRIAVVTGANRGIGLELCRQISKLGISVVLTARDSDAGNLAREKLAEEGINVRFHQLDVTDRESIQGLTAFMENGPNSGQLGRVDILVNNAGIYIDRGISPLEVGAELVRRTMETNFYGALRLTQSLVPMMKRNRYGRVVNVSSQMGSLTDMGRGGLAYRVSKSALNAMTRVLANELRGANILVNSVDPGWVRTDMGGRGATRSLAEGADTAVWLATLPDGGPTGGFFRDRRPRAW
jgi:NAD(P)-dependent dehydrogenase (short-subunit alcohol dehydrogenase family)